jgi:hypothetical protein
MYKAQRISQSSTMRLNGRFDQVFPLFGPVREKEWAAGWDPQILLCEDENIEEHMVFQTPAHLEDSGETYTWIVSKYLPERGLIEYTVFAQHRLWWILVDCQQESDEERCAAKITYTFVSLNPRGEELNTTSMGTIFKHDLKDWEHAINHYLETGLKLQHHH